MTLLIKLLVAHFIGDFILQTKSIVHDKQQNKLRSKKLYLHVLIHAVLVFGLIMNVNYWKGLVLLVLSHLAIDLWKLYNVNKENHRTLFIIDQAMHILVILVVSNYYTPWLWNFVNGINQNDLLLFILALLLTTVVSSHFIKVIISKWQPENEDGDEDSLTNAGSYIGILERLFVFGFILSGNLQGIGFLLAAKSVFRFGDLKDSIDRKLTEYILIGTLLSFGFAILIGHLYLQMKGKV